jgi:hypothetical protein
MADISQQTALWLDIPISEYFLSDPRPIFIVDIALNPPAVVFLNSPAQGWVISEEKGTSIRQDLRHGAADFEDWMLANAQTTPFNHCYRGGWAAVVLRGRWKVVTGDMQSMEVNSLSPSSRELLDHGAYSPGRENHDWTSIIPTSRLTPFTQSLRDFDWAHTPLGATEGWTSQLRQMANLVLVPYLLQSRLSNSLIMI